jgi:hypothetical protein
MVSKGRASFHWYVVALHRAHGRTIARLRFNGIGNDCNCRGQNFPVSAWRLRRIIVNATR